jgi:ectoine hydroxylase-related dioxygenase (phytanoyl-CoA dioxygenase family)
MLNIPSAKFSNSKIIKYLKNDGAIYITDFFTKNDIDELLNEFNLIQNSNLNGNNCGLVYYENQKFISQTLVHSKSIYDFLKSKEIFGLAKNFLVKPVIKATRYYMTGGGGVSMWHHDEKNDGYASKGMIMIVYLNDVLKENDGPFEFIRGTHHNSLTIPDKEFFTEKIEQKYKNKITTVYGRAGTIIFADSRVIHRAMPHNNKNYRKSLFFQISKQEKNMYKERILLNPAFMSMTEMKNTALMQFFGFGLNAVPQIYPPTDMQTLPFNKEVISKVLKWIIHKSISSIFESLPVFFKRLIRKKLGREKDYNAIKK